MSEALTALVYILATCVAFCAVAYIASLDPGAWPGYGLAGGLLFSRATLPAAMVRARLDRLRARIHAATTRSDR